MDFLGVFRVVEAFSKTIPALSDFYSRHKPKDRKFIEEALEKQDIRSKIEAILPGAGPGLTNFLIELCVQGVDQFNFMKLAGHFVELLKVCESDHERLTESYCLRSASFRKQFDRNPELTSSVIVRSLRSFVATYEISKLQDFGWDALNEYSYYIDLSKYKDFVFNVLSKGEQQFDLIWQRISDEQLQSS